ncbi:armadillo-type protein [Parasitella parasitica]|nr:armadillo-type protein [Parasitella parasitica]
MPLLWQKLVDTTCALPISAASLKFIESYATAIHESGDISPENVLWWQTIVESYLQKAATNQEMPSVRVAACDCFASMSKDIFESFHYRYQRLAITLIFSLASDADPNVRAAACRALGVFVLFPSLRDDPLFFSDMLKVILLQKDDKTILVRVRASWAIANLCDALVSENDNNASFGFRDYMSTTEWIQVLEMSTNGSLDNEKLRSNAVRAIGSLLRVTPKEYYENTRIMSLVKNAMQGLEKNIEAGSLKVRWNACHATSNMLLNPHFPIGFIPKEGGIYPWTHTLYQSLIHSLLHCKNFKVRINACLALTTPKQRDQYGDKLVKIVESILEAWSVCEKNAEYKEIKYKQQLEQQVSSLYVLAYMSMN